jgi:hypothetical protein
MFASVLKRNEDFDVTIRTEDGSDQFTGLTITCCLVPPTGSQINVAGVVASGGASVSFRVLGDLTASWPVGLWSVEIWSDNGAGSIDEIVSGTLRVIPSNATVP